MTSSSVFHGLREDPSFHKTSTRTSSSSYLWPSSTRTPPSTFAQNKFNSCSSSSRSISKFDEPENNHNTSSPTPTPPFQCSSTRTAFSAFYVNAKSPSFSTRTSFAQIGADETRKNIVIQPPSFHNLTACNNQALRSFRGALPRVLDRMAPICHIPNLLH
jgi:hypothetical protein